jgi:hypothetical protein
MLISLAYRLTRKLLGALATVAQRDVSKDAEVLVLRHENAVLRRHVEKVHYQPEDRLCFAALSRLIPRRRRAEVFPVTPGHRAGLASQTGGRQVHHHAHPARTPADRRAAVQQCRSAARSPTGTRATRLDTHWPQAFTTVETCWRTLIRVRLQRSITWGCDRTRMTTPHRTAQRCAVRGSDKE